MRFVLTLITSLIVLIPASGQGEWEIVEVEIDTLFPLTDVQFIDRDIGFIGGGTCGRHFSGGVLYKTIDGGKNWNYFFYGKDVQGITSIHFFNDSIGFGIFCCGELLKPQDGGDSWSGHANMGEGKVTNFFFLNDSTGWVALTTEEWNPLRNNTKIFRTINGGDDWEEINYDFAWEINSLFFLDESTGWVVEELGYIGKYNMNDGWKELPRVTWLPLNKVFFIDRDNGWIAGGFNDQYYFKPIFMRTVDGGENWATNTEMNYLINDFYFDTKNHGWAVGEDKAEIGVILETFNGGVGWKVVKDSLHSRLNALDIKDGVGWAVGDDGLILKCDSIATGMKGDNKINSGNESFFQNYPNPFQSTTTISYQLPAYCDVELSVYDLSGRKVATLVNETQLADRYEVEWNAEGMNPGIYFCELKTGQGRQVMKMILID